MRQAHLNQLADVARKLREAERSLDMFTDLLASLDKQELNPYLRPIAGAMFEAHTEIAAIVAESQREAAQP